MESFHKTTDLEALITRLESYTSSRGKLGFVTFRIAAKTFAQAGAIVRAEKANAANIRSCL
jgi:hypothetical protein